MTTLGTSFDPSPTSEKALLDVGSPRAPRLCDVLFFARVSDLAKTRSAKIEVEGGMTIAGFRALLIAHFPQLKPILPFCALAVDDMMASDTDKIGDIQTIAVLPPVSGG